MDRVLASLARIDAAYRWQEALPEGWRLKAVGTAREFFRHLMTVIEIRIVGRDGTARIGFEERVWDEAKGRMTEAELDESVLAHIRFGLIVWRHEQEAEAEEAAEWAAELEGA